MEGNTPAVSYHRSLDIHILRSNSCISEQSTYRAVTDNHAFPLQAPDAGHDHDPSHLAGMESHVLPSPSSSCRNGLTPPPDHQRSHNPPALQLSLHLVEQAASRSEQRLFCSAPRSINLRRRFCPGHGLDTSVQAPGAQSPAHGQDCGGWTCSYVLRRWWECECPLPYTLDKRRCSNDWRLYRSPHISSATEAMAHSATPTSTPETRTL